jgi:hypothetical protein
VAARSLEVVSGGLSCGHPAWCLVFWGVDFEYFVLEGAIIVLGACVFSRPSLDLGHWFSDCAADAGLSGS